MQRGASKDLPKITLTEYWYIFRQELFDIFHKANLDLSKENLREQAEAIFADGADYTDLVEEALKDPQINVISGKPRELTEARDALQLKHLKNIPDQFEKLSDEDVRHFLRFFFYGMKMVLTGQTLEAAINKQGVADTLEVYRDEMLKHGIPTIRHPIGFTMAQIYQGHLSRFIDQRIYSSSFLLRQFMYGEKYLRRAADEREMVAKAIRQYEISLLPEDEDVTRIKRIISGVMESVSWLKQFDAIFLQHVSSFLGPDEKPATQSTTVVSSQGYWASFVGWVWGNGENAEATAAASTADVHSEPAEVPEYLQPILLRIEIIERLIVKIIQLREFQQNAIELGEGFQLIEQDDAIDMPSSDAATSEAASSSLQADENLLAAKLAEISLENKTAKARLDEANFLLAILKAQTQFYEWFGKVLAEKPTLDAFSIAYFEFINSIFQSISTTFHFYKESKPDDSKLAFMQEMIPQPPTYFASWCEAFEDELPQTQQLLLQYAVATQSGGGGAAVKEASSSGNKLTNWFKKTFR